MAHRLAFRAFLFLCFCAGGGCANLRIPTPSPQNVISLPGSETTVYGLTKDEPAFEYLAEALSRVPVPVRNCIVFFSIHPDNSKKHFETEPAHCHSHAKKICILKNDLRLYSDSLECIWHEIAHAYFASLPTSALDEWKKIAGDVYGRPYDPLMDFFKDFPQKGCLTLYSLTDYGEDLAEFNKAVYAYVYLYKKHRFVGTNYFRGEFEKDPRYLQKLKFLLKWGFITQEHYDLIEPLLTATATK